MFYNLSNSMASFTVCTSDLPAEGPVEHISHYFIQPHLEKQKSTGQSRTWNLIQNAVEKHDVINFHEEKQVNIPAVIM